MSLLARIKKLREENGNISINRLEKEAGLSRGSMAKWDEHAPSYDKLKKVADYFNVPVETLTGESEKKEPPKNGGLTVKDWEAQAENWSDSDVLEAMQALIRIQQRRQNNGR